MTAYDNNNVFAKILRGEIPSVKVFEDDKTLAFMDVMPQAEGHVLVEGEIWNAVASEPIPAGTRLRVVGHEEYLLRVAPLEPSTPPQTAA